MTTRRKALITIVLMLAGLLLPAGSKAFGQFTLVWSPPLGTGSWYSFGYWHLPDGTPFNNSPTANDDAYVVNFNSVTVPSSAATARRTYVINGQLDITGGGSLTNTYGSIGEVNGSFGAVTVGGSTGTSTWTNGTQLVVGNFGGTGTGTLNINAGGLVITSDLAGGNATSRINFNGGTLRITAADTAVNAMTLLAGGGTIDVPGGLSFPPNAFQLTGVIDGAGGLTKTGTGTLVLLANNTYTGPTTVSSGALAVGFPNGLSASTAVTVAPFATFASEFQQRMGSLSGAGRVELTNGTLTTGSDNTSTTFSGEISGAAACGLTKVGTGTFTLSGVNAFLGPTTVSAGTLSMGVVNGLHLSSGMTIASGATFNLAGYSQSIRSLSGAGSVTLGAATLTTGVTNASTTFSGVINGTGGLTKTGTGTLTLSGANNYTGATTVSAGTLAMGAAYVLSSSTAVTVANGASLSLNGHAQNIGSLAGEGNVALGSGTLTAGFDNSSTYHFGDISGTGGFAKAGTGDLTLYGSNNYSGPTTVTGGRLRVAPSAMPGSTAVTVFAGATFELGQQSVAIGSLAGAGSVTMDTHATLTTGSANTSTSYAGVVSGGGGLTKTGTGTFTLTGANSYTAGTTVSTGRLLVMNATGTATGTGDVNVNTGATLGGGNAAGTQGFIRPAGGNMVTVNGTLAPGDGPGAIGVLTIGTSTAQTWLSVPGTYSFNLATTNAGSTTALTNGGSSATRTATTGNNLLAVLGTSGSIVDLTGVTIQLNAPSATLGGNWDNTKHYSWQLATLPEGVTPTLGSTTFNTTGFLPTLNGGSFSLSFADATNSLQLNYSPAPVPEPVLSLLACGGVGVCCFGRKTRQSRDGSRAKLARRREKE